MISFAFDTLGLNRVHAHHLVRNGASGRVLAKAGMLVEGCHRQYLFGMASSRLAVCAILRSDFENDRTAYLYPDNYSNHPYHIWSTRWICHPRIWTPQVARPSSP